MKQKDIAILIVVAVVGAIFSFVLSSQVFSTQKTAQEVEKIDKIDASFKTPSDRYFNSNSFNPAQRIEIGKDTNQDPFAGGQ